MEIAPILATRGTARPSGHKRRLRMLLTSAGRRVALLLAFRAAAEKLGIELEIFACDMNPDWSAACQMADGAFAVPYAGSAEYAEAIRQICLDLGITLVVPTIDTELDALSRACAAFAKEGIHVSVSEPPVIAIARDKLLTAQVFGGLGIPCPVTAALSDARSEPARWNWPVFVKPRHGSAGRQIYVAHEHAELGEDQPEPMIVQEFLQGEEWTINLFVGRSGTLHAVVPHRRVSIRAGEVEKGVTQRVPALEEIARLMVAGIPGMRGTLCFQAMIRPDGAVSVFEINARFGGGYPLADRAGAPFAKWLLEEQCGLPSTANNDWVSGVTMLRFDDAIFR